jgi:putative PIN family toxin of toxin-antitoxin system
MTHAVLDTNVLVAGLIRSSGPPGRIVDALRDGSVIPVFDDRILDEYGEVLKRPFFSRYFGQVERESVLSFIEGNGERTMSACRMVGLPDLSDAAFAEVAVTAGVPLVTGNVKHFPVTKCAGLTVLTPAEFVRQLR